MIQIIDKSKCCGCTACASICTHDAISMQPDILGFPYPIVDSNKCIDCGLCEKVCSFNDHYDISQNLPQPLVYAVRHKNTHEIETSRSGGAFIAISDYWSPLLVGAWNFNWNFYCFTIYWRIAF